MLERGTETNDDDPPVQQALPGTVIAAQFARDDHHFAFHTTSQGGVR